MAPAVVGDAETPVLHGAPVAGLARFEAGAVDVEKDARKDGA